MSTPKHDAVSLENALASIPNKFRSRLIKHYHDLKRAHTRGDFDACGARAGKFAETMIRFIQDRLEGKHHPFGKSLNLYDESRRLERLPAASGPEPFRVFLPRALCFLYTLRNKRGFAHIGGDVDSDPIDAAACVRVADWCLCELLRVVHSLSLEEAQALTNAIAAREVPDVWSVAGRRRVLRDGLDYKDETLLLLYSDPAEAVLIEDLLDWTEYSRMDHFKARVLAKLHRDRLIEWDKRTGAAHISPKGIARVEEELLDSAAYET